MTVYHNYLAVFGRIPEDSEDSVLFFEHMSVEQALSAFEGQVYERFSDEAMRAQARQNSMERHDKAVFITTVLASQSPIEEQSL